MSLENFDDNNTKNILKDITNKLNVISQKNDLILEGVVNTLQEIVKNQSNINSKLLQLQNDIQKNQAYVKDSAILSSGIQNDVDDIKVSLDAISEHLDVIQTDVLNIKIFKTVENI